MAGFNECKCLWEVWESGLKVDYNERSECILGVAPRGARNGTHPGAFFGGGFEHLKIV